MCSKFNVEASCEEEGAGLLLQWGCNLSGSKIVLVPLDVTEVFANISVFCAVNSPGRISYTMLYTPHQLWLPISISLQFK